MPACSATRLSNMNTLGGTWVPRQRPQPNWNPYCPWLPVRYNCMEKNTTADAFEFTPDVPGCSVSSLESAFEALAGKRLVACGDSFMGQYVYELACRFQHRVVRFNNLVPPFPPEIAYTNGTYGREHYFNASQMDVWKQLAADRPPRFTAAPNAKLGTQELNGQKTYYGIHGYSIMWFDNNLTLVYRNVRGFPGGNEELLDACLNAGNVIGWDESEVSAYVVSEFYGYAGGDGEAYGIAKMWERLWQRSQASVPIYYVPSWSYGSFGTYGPHPNSWPTRFTSQATAAGNVSVDRRGRPVMPLTEFGSSRSSSKGRVVDLTKTLYNLINSRQYDAHAQIYPFKAYVNGTPWTCKKGMMHGNFKKHCEPWPWHICVTKPCHATAKEGHFCQPGPVDSFVRIVLHAIAHDKGDDNAAAKFKERRKEIQARAVASEVMPQVREYVRAMIKTETQASEERMKAFLRSMLGSGTAALNHG